MQIPGLELVTSNSGTGQHQLRRCNSIFRQEPRRCRDRRAGRHHAGHREACPWICRRRRRSRRRIPTISRSCTSGSSDSVTEGQLYDYANTQVGERISILPGVSQVTCSARSRPCASRPIPRRWPPATSPWTISPPHQKRHRATPAPDSLTASTDVSDPAPGPARRRRGLQQSHRRPENGAPVYLNDVAEVKEQPPGRAHQHALLDAGHHVPSATVVIAVFRRAGSNAVEVARASAP